MQEQLCEEAGMTQNIFCKAAPDDDSSAVKCNIVQRKSIWFWSIFCTETKWEIGHYGHASLLHKTQYCKHEILTRHLKEVGNGSLYQPITLQCSLQSVFPTMQTPSKL